MVLKPGLEEQILELEKWLKTQQQLPQDIGIFFKYLFMKVQMITKKKK